MLLTQVPSSFAARRERLLNAHSAAAFIFPSSSEVLRNPDVHHPFRQESNFFYLSGFEEPESVLVLAPSKTAGSSRMILFVRRRDPMKEMWEGERYGIEGALQIFGAHEAYPIEEFGKKLPELLKGLDKVYYRLNADEKMDRQILAALETQRSSSRSAKLLPIVDPGEVLGEMRLFKSSEEVELLRNACRVSALGHKEAMKVVRPGMNEFEIEALVDYVFRKNGCQRLGYGSIVAGGKNAACLHYRANNEVLKDGDLLLIDAGGEYNYYTGDVTRTFPIGSGFSKAQAKAYDLVLSAQKEAIALAKPGRKIPEMHRRACEVIADGLLSLGLIQAGSGQSTKTAIEEAIKSEAYKKFYPHGTSHWLGMDVHDAGMYTKDGAPRALEPGMCLTVEPGFYVQPADAEMAGEFSGIGIRIEDDILITPSGCEIMTRDAPKERAEIEALRN
jgi:Xaa-Pro aminopeptidase